MIATGSQRRQPRVEGLDGVKVWTNGMPPWCATSRAQVLLFAEIERAAANLG